MRMVGGTEQTCVVIHVQTGEAVVLEHTHVDTDGYNRELLWLYTESSNGFLSVTCRAALGGGWTAGRSELCVTKVVLEWSAVLEEWIG